MKEWKLRLLILFSLASILGLMVIQAYWIRDAIDIKESHFNQTVNQAVTNAIWRLEHLAISREEQIKKHLIKNKEQFITSADSIVTKSNNEGSRAEFTLSGKAKPIEKRKKVPQKAINKDSLLVKPILDTQTDNVPTSTPKLNFDDQELVLINTLSDSILYRITKSMDQTAKYIGARDYLELLLDEISAKNRNNRVKDLLDSTLLTSMIREELEKEGIHLQFVFGVYFPFTGKMLFCDTIVHQTPLKESNFVYSLFPNFKLSKPVYLMLYFPGKKSYLFARLGKVLSLSLILTLLLIWSFYFITRNVYRQKKLGEMKNDFINNMTHEFKTPVSTISLACEALRDKEMEKSAEMIHNYLHIIDEENKRLGKLAEQILQTAVIDKGHLYLTFEPVEIHGLILQLIEKYRPVIEQKSGRISTKLLAADSTLSGDRTHLYNMISNLVDNAIKYSGTKTEIEILTTDSKNQFVFSIQDRGIGISKSNQKRIFEKLYRVPTGNLHDTKGFGLGLSYVKYIVGRHEGTIQVESEINKGSTFIITLPRQPMQKQGHG